MPPDTESPFRGLRYDVEHLVRLDEFLVAKILIDYQSERVHLLSLWYGEPELGYQLAVPCGNTITHIECELKDILETSGEWCELEPKSIPDTDDDMPRIVSA